METISLSITADNLKMMLSLGFLGFLLCMALTPLYTTIAYKKQWWKKQRTEA